MANKAKWHTCEGRTLIYVYIYVCIDATQMCDELVYAVYVNETVARRMSYRYYFYRSAGNFTTHRAISLYWRKVRGK